MIAFDLYWRSNEGWWEFQNHIPTIRKDAPEEAQRSYQHYLQQMRKVMEEEEQGNKINK